MKHESTVKQNKSLCSMLLKREVLCALLFKREASTVYYGSAFRSWTLSLARHLDTSHILHKDKASWSTSLIGYSDVPKTLPKCSNCRFLVCVPWHEYWQQMVCSFKEVIQKKAKVSCTTEYISKRCTFKCLTCCNPTLNQ